MYNCVYLLGENPMSTRENYIQSLHWRLNDLKSEIAELQIRIQDIFLVLEQKREQAQHIMKLLATEGVEIDDPELASLTMAISDIVNKYLSSQGNKSPVHYNNITQALMSKGILIPGKNPAANLLSHISRDQRFVRTSPGTYGLKEWGISEMKTPSKRKTKKRK